MRCIIVRPDAGDAVFITQHSLKWKGRRGFVCFSPILFVNIDVFSNTVTFHPKSREREKESRKKTKMSKQTTMAYQTVTVVYTFFSPVPVLCGWRRVGVVYAWGARHSNQRCCCVCTGHMCPTPSNEIKLRFFVRCGCWHCADTIKKGFVGFCGFMACESRCLEIIMMAFCKSNKHIIPLYWLVRSFCVAQLTQTNALQIHRMHTQSKRQSNYNLCHFSFPAIVFIKYLQMCWKRWTTLYGIH